jgi:tryptophan synthase alpha chain
MAAVETAFASRQRPLLVTYLTGGMRDDWPDLVDAMVDGGADAVEIGLPFSDPMLEGTAIQQACAAALARGATVDGVLAALPAQAVPVIAMTYANHAWSRGLDTYCRRLREAGVDGSILCDLPVGEADGYVEAATAAGLDPILMVTPSTPADRVADICARSRGFVYAMSVMATTGSGDAVGDTGWATADRARAVSRLPVLIGFGITGAPSAVAAARHADGVVVGSALVRQILAGATPAAVAATVGAIRKALGEVDSEG